VEGAAGSNVTAVVNGAFVTVRRSIPALFIPVLFPRARSLHRSLCHLLPLGSFCLLRSPEALPTAHLPVTASCQRWSWQSHTPCLRGKPGHPGTWVSSLLCFQLRHLGRWFNPSYLRCSATCLVAGLCIYHQYFCARSAWQQCPS